MHKYCLILVALVLTVSACDSWEAVDPMERELEPHEHADGSSKPQVKYTHVSVKGFVRFGFENSYFYPCGSEEVWWVSGGADIAKRYSQVRAKSNERVFVRMIGMKSELGRFGHLGGSRREFIVTKVIEIRKGTSIDCK